MIWDLKQTEWEIAFGPTIRLVQLDLPVMIEASIGPDIYVLSSKINGEAGGSDVAAMLAPIVAPVASIHSGCRARCSGFGALTPYGVKRGFRRDVSTGTGRSTRRARAGIRGRPGRRCLAPR